MTRSNLPGKLSTRCDFIKALKEAIQPMAKGGIVRIIGISVLIILALAGCANKPTEKELFQKAREALSEKRYYTAVNYYEQILTQFSQSENRYKAIFMIGFVNTEYLHNPEIAVQYFHRLIKEFPTCDLVDDAHFLLGTIDTVKTTQK